MAENTATVQDVVDAKMAKDPKTVNRQINATVTVDEFDKLEGYAFGTRRTVSALVKHIVKSWIEDNADEIKSKSV